MMNKKTFLAFVIGIFMLCGLTACSQGQAKAPEAKRS